MCGLSSHLQCEAPHDTKNGEFPNSLTVSLSQTTCKRICQSWTLLVDLNAWLEEVSDRVVSVVVEEGNSTIEQGCK
jgi:hypothetical protein